MKKLNLITIVLATITTLIIISSFAFGQDTLYVHQSGLVGIGDTTPDNKLDVYGSIGVSGAIGEGIQFTTNGETSADIIMTTRGGTDYVYIRNAADTSNKSLSAENGWFNNSIHVSGSIYDYYDTIVTIYDDLYVAGGHINLPYGNNALESYDEWLRINDGGEHSSGVYIGGAYFGSASNTWYAGGYSQETADANIYAGWYGYGSDERLKKNINPITNALDKVLQLKGVSFEWKDPEKLGQNLGFIAQDVEKIFPEVVHTSEDGDNFKSVGYGNLIAPIIEAVKELKTEKDTEIEMLLDLIDELQSRIEILEKNK